MARRVDIAKSVGRDTAESLRGTANVTNGELNIRFVGVHSATQVNSIEVVADGHPSPVSPVATAKAVQTRSGPVVTPQSFGAVGDGRTDDTAALQRFFDAGGPGTTLELPAGTTYAFSSVLHLTRPGTLLVGGGELLATHEATSSVWVQADDVTIEGAMTFRTQTTTHRWTAWEEMGMRVGPSSGDVIQGITITGSAAAGLYLGGASNFVVSHVTVRNTRADGIHMTGGSHNGQVIDPTVVESGDDGIAVVSYKADGVICHDITVVGATVDGTSGGRGMSVVGGRSITYRDFVVRESDAAGVYIAAEGSPWYTYAPTDVTVADGQLIDTNTDVRVDHGAILVMTSAAGYAPSDVNISDVVITGTRTSVSRDAGVVTYGTAPSLIAFSRITILGGPVSAYQGNAPSNSYTTTDWTQNGRSLPDHR